MRAWLRDVLARRPGWMNVLLAFCLYMALVYVPWDFLAKPVARDQEVWLGMVLTGWAAKATEPLHWALYAAGAYGLWRMRPWLWPWAAVYAASVAIGMAVWPIGRFGGMRGVALGAASFVPFAVLTVALWRARDRFQAPRRALRERYGEWALVTGASSGIGAAFARALAREGCSLVLVARRGERLRGLAAELEKERVVATRVVPLDLGEPDAAERLLAAVRDLEIAVLVNNAGFGSAGDFEQQDPQRLAAMVALHCAVPLLLTRRLLPAMRARGRGAVLFTSSLAARQPMPLHAAYAATKSFESLLGEALWAELRGSGVDVLVVEPGTTDTEFQSIAGEVPHRGARPEDVVALALERLGEQPSVAVGWWPWLRGNLGMRLLPRALLALVARDVVTRHLPPGRKQTADSAASRPHASG
jgi:short-subunit dehydrogenase